MAGPLALIAEITHRCPLHCVYCSNPLEMKSRAEELPAKVWIEAFKQAAALGALQLDLTGGEPLARADLTELVAAARNARLYTNLITSGIGLTAERLDALVRAGLDHIQLSFQDSREEPANEFAGAAAHERKLAIAAEIAKHRLAFTMNIVVHRRNLARLEEMIALAEQLGAHRLEIAHVQYYGWAIENRESLLPSREQVERSLEIIRAAEERLRGRMRIEYVVPDYYAIFPKACMGGWGRKLMLIDPSGHALPCHAAGVIPGMQFEKITERSVEWIWEQSPSFTRFRGEDWMPEPCRSCDRRTLDFGGCRCQALLLAGDANVTDPVCSLAPSHGIVTEILEKANAPATPALDSSQKWIYRVNPS
ncbi:MAG: pyrroloquinoline quinone biosynthesis protein PqqE [Candidatus Acidiferrales bacterium]|jgi:pyrroloquinoline quinone biosynthesis protein E